jgi:hypothetical protein
MLLSCCFTNTLLPLYPTSIRTIIFQVNEVLRDIVPEGGGGGEEHAQVVQREVRRYFKKHDTEGRGLVTEERFRTFCR